MAALRSISDETAAADSLEALRIVFGGKTEGKQS